MPDYVNLNHDAYSGHQLLLRRCRGARAVLDVGCSAGVLARELVAQGARNKQIAESPQLRDQQVTQFVIHDGWIGVALGPKAPGRQAAMHPRPAVERE